VDTSIELNQLLHDLRARRTRLTAIAGKGSDFDPDELLMEVGDLTEELLVADAELLAQQEQLDSTRAELEILSAAVSAQAEAAPATITTDPFGAIIATTPAADELLQAATSRTTRPIATRFAVEDRPAIRTVISRVSKAAPGTEASTLARLIRRDHTTMPVRVTATNVVDPVSAESRLTWLLEPADASRASKVTTTVGEDARALIDACYTISAGLDRGASVAQLAQSVARVAADIALTEAAAVTYLLNPKQFAVEATTSAAREAADSEFVTREGPAHSTLSDADIRQFDAGNADAWPAHAQYLQALGLRYELAFPLSFRNVRATLSVFQGGDRPFAPEVRERLTLLARHAATVLAQADVETNLRVAVDSRQTVGQAVGILVERHRITPQAAFDRLAHASNVSQSKLRDLAAVLIETGEEPKTP
jgi:hypothetical protein